MNNDHLLHPHETNLGKEFIAFKSLIYNYKDPKKDTEPAMKQLLQKLTIPSNEWNLQLGLLSELYYFIQEVRIYFDRDISYLLIFLLYDFNRMWATQAVIDMVQYYGSWKDIKYFCNFCKQKTGTTTHPLILFSISVLEQRLKMDFIALQGKQCNLISYAAKWTPREKTKYNWIYSILATSYFGYLTQDTKATVRDKAFNKSKMELRKILSTLNRHLNTLEIKMCNNGDWDDIYLENTPIHAIFKYYKAFCRKNIHIGFNITSTSSRKISCKQLFKFGKRVEKDSRENIEYKHYFDNLIRYFCTAHNSPTLCVIDLTNITQTLLQKAIGFSSLYADCVFIIEPSGNFLFVPFKNTPMKHSFTDKFISLTTKINVDEVPLNCKATNETDKQELLLNGLRFLDSCYDSIKSTSDVATSDVEPTERITNILYSSFETMETIQHILKNVRIQYSCVSL